MHKEGNPGRPIISDNGSPTEIISKFVDFHIQDLVKHHHHTSKTTWTVFAKSMISTRLVSSLQVHFSLCTMDACALYTNIPHAEGITACREAMIKWREHITKPSARFLCNLIQHILTLNFLQFEDNLWLQTHGTAMGTSMAPSYANLFMGALEGKMLNSSPHQPLIWLRYLDDIYLIWTHGSSTLDQFLAHAKNFHPTIQFTSEISPLKIPFLGVMITLQGGRLETDPYTPFRAADWKHTHTLNLQTLSIIYIGVHVTLTTLNAAYHTA
ncbi:hypothetical protein ElyMa_006252000 [Elysia marginata]|uniref:Reverse transcriptase domain-containing protein n=1 Tax=Elysia marginata TaxID=1093978 RepID=A0AAV4HAQ2_9GAST|nr:hypothetical protein ElyMa_006252000 [Elysia marginata]